MKSPRAVPLAALAALACGGGASPPAAAPAVAPGPPTGAALLGRWEYVAPRPAPRALTLGTGLRVAIEFDSAAGGTAFGRVATWFAGDLGLSPALFGRVEGAVGPGSATRVTIPFARSQTPPVTIQGQLAGDTLRINDARRGEEPGPFSTAAVFVRRAQ